MWCAQIAIEEAEYAVDLGTDLRILRDREHGRERKQHESMIVCVTAAVDDGAVGTDHVHIALAVRTASLLQHVVEPLQGDVLSLREPLHLRRLGERIDLPCLHANAPRCGAVRST